VTGHILPQGVKAGFTLYRVPAAVGSYFPALWRAYPRGKREIGSFDSSAQAAALAASFGRWEQSRTDATRRSEGIVTIEVYITIIIDICGIVRKSARRPKPPPEPV